MSLITNIYGGINGRNYNFFQKLTITRPSFVGLNCDILIPFDVQGFSMHLESGGPISYSFDGYNLHGDMTSGKASQTLQFDKRTVCKVWFSGTGVVRFEAWPKD